MKQTLLIALAFITLQATAQTKGKLEKSEKMELREKIKDFSPEQRAELRVKKMALNLDLSEAQQKQLYPIELEMANERAKRKKNKAEMAKLSKNELFEMKKASLEKKASTKNRYKAILTPEQFEKWEKSKHRKGRAVKRKMSKKGLNR